MLRWRKPSSQNLWSLAPVRIAAIYAVVGALWIAFSDRLLAALVTDPRRQLLFQTYKGWLFVAASALLIYGLVQSHLRVLARSEDERLESQRRLATLLSNLPGMAYRCRNTPDWTMEFVSEGARELTGYHPSDLVNDAKVAYGELIHPDDRASVWDEVQASLKERRPFQLTYRIRRAEGNEKWVWEQGRGVYGPAGELEALEGIISDLTQQKSLEAQFRQAQKMEAVGRLAGGVAHDFNNLLSVITGYAELLIEQLSENGQARQRVEEIYKASDRAAGLTRQLLAFSRKQILRPRVVDLNVLVAGVEKMLRRLLGEDIEIVTTLAPALHRVKTDPGQMEQVLMNIAVNARDAMPQGGRLTIETANVEVDDSYAKWHAGVRAGNYVMLAVSDTGVGMDGETQAHIFEPFFTTKPEGEGTGLGLATVFGIVQQSGGHIWVYSEPGQGTTFKIYLPQVEEAVEAPEREEAALELPRGAETILVVEDAEPLRRLACEFLELAGYRVVQAADGEEALALAAKHQDEIDLLFTDVVLPGMTGRELAQRLARVSPGLKVVYASGYSGGTFDASSTPEAPLDYLQKPFSRMALLRTVRAALDRPQNARTRNHATE